MNVDFVNINNFLKKM